METILADGWLATMNPARDVFGTASVWVDKDRIVVGTRAGLARAYPEAEGIDCRGQIVMPGMVNTHTHLFRTLLKGTRRQHGAAGVVQLHDRPERRAPDRRGRESRGLPRLHRIAPVRRHDARGL